MKKLFCLSLVSIMLLSGCSDSERKDSDDKNKSREEKTELYDNFSSKSSQDSPAVAATNMTTSQKNALSSAKSYLKYSAFSYEGLIDQLEYEGYPHEDCVYAVDNCGADWFDQAVKCAESYLKYSSFSYSELVEQLEYEGFTYEQAVYGAKQNGF